MCDCELTPDAVRGNVRLVRYREEAMMPRPRILPDEEVLRELVSEPDPLTYQAIADRYGVTRAAVHLALQKHNLIKRPRPRFDKEIPWKVHVEHQGQYPLLMLRAAARRDRGLPLAVTKARYLDNWLAKLHRQDAVVAYHPESGFYYTARRPGVDTGLIRIPQWLLDEPQ